MYVGDDRIRDIFPAKEMGMKVAFYLSSLRECTQWRDFEAQPQVKPDLAIEQISD